MGRRWLGGVQQKTPREGLGNPTMSTRTRRRRRPRDDALAPTVAQGELPATSMPHTPEAKRQPNKKSWRRDSRVSRTLFPARAPHSNQSPPPAPDEIIRPPPTTAVSPLRPPPRMSSLADELLCQLIGGLLTLRTDRTRTAWHFSDHEPPEESSTIGRSDSVRPRWAPSTSRSKAVPATSTLDAGSAVAGTPKFKAEWILLANGKLCRNRRMPRGIGLDPVFCDANGAWLFTKKPRHRAPP